MRDIITSKSNEKVKYAKKIVDSSSFRRSENKFIVDGTRMCEEAFKNKADIDTIFYTKKCLEKFEKIISDIIKVAKNNFEVSEEIISHISDTDTPQGVLCICGKKNMLLSDLNLSIINKAVLIESVQNPSNLGSIFRTCDALNVDLIIICGQTCDIYNPKVLRGSMGAVFRMDYVLFGDTLSCLNMLKSAGFETYATVPCQDAQNIDEVKFNKKSVVVMGNEGNGLLPETIKFCDCKITIPMNKAAESLNVSVATGIVIWEMMKGYCYE